MLRRILLASAGAVALTTAAGAAELLPTKPPPPYVPPPPLLTWTGFYAGLNVGGTWSASNTTNVTSANISALHDAIVVGDDLGPVSALTQSGAVGLRNRGGVIGGGQVGYNYQFASPGWSSFVVGIEADIQGLSARSRGFFGSSATDALGLNTVNSTIATEKSVDWLGTVRGRLGWLATPTLLIFGDGGLAYGGARANTLILSADSPTLSAAGDLWTGSFGAFNQTRVGWTAGGGLEWMFMPNWSLKVEYLYYDLGRVAWSNGVNSLINAGVDFLGTAPGTVLASNISSSDAHFNGHIVRAGLNYHFFWGAPPVVAKY